MSQGVADTPGGLHATPFSQGISSVSGGVSRVCVSPELLSLKRACLMQGDRSGETSPEAPEVEE